MANSRVVAVYRITCSSNGKIYIGSSKNMYKRWYEHRRCLRQNKHHCIRLQRAWNKYGEASFTFEKVEVVNDPKYLIDREQYWIDHLKVYDNKIGFNSSKKANTPNCIPWTQKRRDLQSKRYLGRKLSQATKNKIGLSQTGEKHHCASVKDDDVVEIVNMWNCEQNAKNISKKIGCTISVVHSIIGRVSWTHITDTLHIKPFSRNGSKHHNAKLNEDIVLSIKQDIQNKVPMLAKKYNVSPSTISDIKYGRTWNHV